MLLSRCCDKPVEHEWVGILLIREALICTGCNKEISYKDTVWVKTS